MSPGRTVHPGDDRDRLQAYLAGRLSVEERVVLERHLADCEACRSRLVELHFEPDEVEQAFPPLEPWLSRARALGDTVPRVGRVRMLAAGLAAAALGGGLWLSWNRQAPSSEAGSDAGGPVFRVEDAVQTLELLTPAEGTLLPRGPVDLKWTAVVDAVYYRVVVLDLAGVPLAEHRTEEPHWRWPGGAGDSFWYVEAELSDGSRLESEANRLVFVSADSAP